MATIQTLQSSIDAKATQYAEDTLKALSTKYKSFLLNNLDPQAYATKEVYKGLPIPKLFEEGNVYNQLRTSLFQQKQSELVTLAITKLS